MKKLFSILFVALLVVGFAFASPSQAAFKDMWAKVYSWDGSMTADGRYELTEITSGVTFVVMQANSVATLETLYYYNNSAFTALANPVSGTNFASDTVCNDMVSFRVDPSETNDTYVDLIVVDQAGGYTAFVENFSEYKHSIIIDERPGVKHHGVAFIYTTGSSSEIDTGIDFDTNSLIHDMILEIGTAFDTDVGINVGILSSGTNGDPDGFISGATLATAGYKSPWRAGVDLTSYSYSSGGEAGAIINKPTVGTFLGYVDAGTSDTADDAGLAFKEQIMLHGTWETSLTYTFSTTAASTGWGMIHYWFTRVR